MARVYAANTLGAIAGALLTSLVLVPQFGTQRTGQLLIAISTTARLLLLLNRKMLDLKMARIALAAAAVAVALCALLIHTVPPLSKLLVAYGRYAATWAGKSDIIYAEARASTPPSPSPSSSTAWSRSMSRAKSKPPTFLATCASSACSVTSPRSPSPSLAPSSSSSAAARASPPARCPSTQESNVKTIVEIEPLVPRAASTYFSEPNFDVLHNPKVRVRSSTTAAITCSLLVTASTESPSIRSTLG